MGPWFDLTGVHEEGIERWSASERLDAARRGREGESKSSRTRTLPDHHHVEARSSIRDPRAERGEFQLTLTDADEHQWCEVLSCDALDLELHAKYREGEQQTHSSNE